MPIVPAEPESLEEYIAANESRHKVKPNNEARIVWYDSTKSKTPYSVIYLHGFYASQGEGDPAHIDFAKKFGCNLYLARLADHGIDTTEQMINVTGDRLWESSKEALVIGKAIGEKVIVMSTSTGSTFALMLAAEYPDDVAALINMSPNIRLADGLAWMGNNPWGLQVARLVLGGKYLTTDYNEERAKYWYSSFRVEAIPQLEEILEDKMNASTFNKVKCPSLTIYYYKNEQEQDPTVSVSAMREMNRELSTPADLKVEKAIPGAGVHVIGSRLVSKDLPAVERALSDFGIDVLKLTPVSPSSGIQ